MPLLRLHSKTIHYTDRPVESPGKPDAPPLIFIHGLGSNENAIFPILPHLTDYRCITLDTYGAGLSPYNENVKTSIPLLADDVIEVLDLLNVDKAVIVGHSMGAVIGAHVAANFRDRVAAFVGLGPVVPDQDPSGMLSARIKTVEKDGMAPVADTLPKLATGPHSTFPQRELIRQCLMTQDPIGYVALCEVIKSAEKPEYQSISAPVLLSTGGEDKSAPPSSCDFIRNSVGSRTKQVEILEGIGHFVCIEDPETVGNIIVRFLGDLLKE